MPKLTDTTSVKKTQEHLEKQKTELKDLQKSQKDLIDMEKAFILKNNIFEIFSTPHPSDKITDVERAEFQEKITTNLNSIVEILGKGKAQPVLEAIQNEAKKLKEKASTSSGSYSSSSGWSIWDYFVFYEYVECIGQILYFIIALPFMAMAR